jgi:cytoskeletal protein RodZ
MTEPLLNSSSMDLLARELKTARVGKKLSLEEVSQLTRIKKHYLEQLEDGNFSFLPKGYVYACIKAYMREMGLEESETLEQCKKELKLLGALNSGNVTKITTDCTSREQFWMRNIHGLNPELLKSILSLTLGIFVGVLGAVGFSYIDENSKVSVLPPTVVNAGRSVRPSKKAVINSSGINQKEKSSPPVPPSLFAKPSPASVDTSVSVLDPAPIRFSGSQRQNP